MPATVLDEYLVKLGANVDQGSFDKFFNTLHLGSVGTSNFAMDAIKQFGKMEVAFIGMTATIGSGIIAMADKTAMADQSYRLLGMRMLMGTNSARAMSMALEDLGASLDEVAFDPELNRRFQALEAQYEHLGKTLGGGFEKNMVSIRDLRMEFKMFERELEFMTMGTVSQLFEKLGFGSGDLLQKLDSLNQWVISNLPHWADEIANDLLPAWQAFTVTMQDTKVTAKQFAGEFTYLVGVLTGDTSIKDSTFDVNNLAHALRDLLDVGLKLSVMAQFFTRGVGHFATATAANLTSNLQAMMGHDNTAATNEANKEADAFVHMLHGLFEDKYRTGSDFTAMNAINAADDARARGVSPSGSSQTGRVPSATTLRSLAQKVAADTGIDASLIYGQWAHETGNFTNRGATSLDNLAGIRIPGTTTYRKFDSLESFASYYEGQLQSSRYRDTGALTAITPEQFSHALKVGGWYEGPESAYSAGVKRYSEAYGRGAGDVNIQTLTINVPHTAQTPHEIKKVVTDSIEQAMRFARRSEIATTYGPY